MHAVLCVHIQVVHKQSIYSVGTQLIDRCGNGAPQSAPAAFPSSLPSSSGDALRRPRVG